VVLVGDRTLWSDYRPLLADLEPDIATYHGPSAAAGLNRLYALADGLIQPAHYEPFALTVGEALASGLYVVVSDEVGAREGVGAEYCRVFPAGDAAAFEGRVRDLVGELRADRDLTPSAGARDEAERLFSPAVVVQTIIAHLSGTPVEAPADRVHA
jgi:glycosyltransferase involved in cell wall biosynthesis